MKDRKSMQLKSITDSHKYYFSLLISLLLISYLHDSIPYYSFPFLCLTKEMKEINSEKCHQLSFIIRAFVIFIITTTNEWDRGEEEKKLSL